DSQTYDVEKIIDKRRINGKDEYRVKWVGYQKPTWEPASNLEACIDMIDDFVKSNARTPKRESKKMTPTVRKTPKSASRAQSTPNRATVTPRTSKTEVNPVKRRAKRTIDESNSNTSVVISSMEVQETPSRSVSPEPRDSSVGRNPPKRRREERSSNEMESVVDETGNETESTTRGWTSCSIQ
ncbi:hypothetical protein PFISCL1PPCAC_15054, partial [Pristionchus fissidentatus]